VNNLNRGSEEPHGTENAGGSGMKHGIRPWNVHMAGFGGRSTVKMNVRSLELGAEGSELRLSDSVPQRHDLN